MKKPEEDRGAVLDEIRQLRQLEQDAGNPTVATLDSVFRLFGMRVGIVAVRRKEVEVGDEGADGQAS